MNAAGADDRDRALPHRIDLARAGPEPVAAPDEAEERTVPEARFFHLVLSSVEQILGPELPAEARAAWERGPSLGSRPVVAVLRRMGEPLLSAVALLMEADSAALRDRCVETFAYVGESSLPTLLTALGNEGAAVRRAAGAAVRLILAGRDRFDNDTGALVRAAETASAWSSRQATINLLRRRLSA